MNPAPKLKVLIVDDDEGVTDLFKMILEDSVVESLHRVQVLVADTEAEAKHLLRDHPDICLAVLELQMQFEDSGLRLANFIHKHLPPHHMRLVLLSSLPQGDEMALMEYHGIHGIYFKDAFLKNTKKYKTLLQSEMRNYLQIIHLKERFERGESPRLLKKPFMESEFFKNACTRISELCDTVQYRSIKAGVDLEALKVEGRIGPEGGLNSELFRGNFQVIADKTARIQAIVKGMEEVSQLAIDFNPESVDMTGMIHQLIDQLEIRNTVNFQPSSEIPPSIETSREGVRRVIHAVLENAVQAGGDQVPEIKVALGFSPGERGLRLKISDMGTGVEKEDLAHLAEAFFTTKARSKGLGLFVASLIIERIGGTLTIQSGPGTTVTLDFPIALKAAQSQSARTP